MKSSYASKLCICIHMLVLLHSIIDRGGHKSISSCHYMEVRKIHSWQHMPSGSISSHSEKVKGRLATFRFQCCLTCFMQKDSVLNTSAINAATKSSMKLQSGTTTNCHRHGRGERSKEQRRTKVSFVRIMMLQRLDLQRLVKRHISGWSNVWQ